MGANAIRQAVVDRPNLNLGLEDAKPPLNIGQRFIAFDDLIGRQIGGIGDQQQLAIHQARMRQSPLINGVGEQLTFEVNPHDARQMRFAHLMVETGAGAAIRQLGTPFAFAAVLIVEFAHPLGCLFFNSSMRAVTLDPCVQRHNWDHGP